MVEVAKSGPAIICMLPTARQDLPRASKSFAALAEGEDSQQRSGTVRPRPPRHSKDQTTPQ